MAPASGQSLATRALWTAYLLAQAPLQRRAAFRSPEAIARTRDRRVRRAVAHAYEHVPHYGEAMDRLGLRPGDFRTAADLARLPVIEREQLQRDPERFVSRARPLESYVKMATDGTTGVPAVIYHDPFALFQGACHTERREAMVLALAGRRLRLRRVFVGSAEGTLARTSRAFRRRSLIPAKLRYTDVRLSMLDPPSATAGPIAAARADLLISYGSYAEALFAHVARTGEPFRAPAVVVYGADGVSEPVRKLIEERFGATVLSQYGAGEAHHIGLECAHHRGLHLNEDVYPVRIVDADRRDLPPGQTGDVVVSNLVNRATVLLNYRVGDRAAKLEGPCPCGRTLERMTLPEGRIDDWVEGPGGEPVHAQAVRGLLLADDRWLLGFQVEQVARGEFEVRIVPTPEADREALAGRIRERFAERFGADTSTAVSFVERLERTRGGKVRVVSSRLTGSPPAVS